MRTPLSGFSFSKRSRMALEHRHVHVGPLDAQHALGGEPDVFDVVVVAQLEPHSLSSGAPARGRRRPVSSRSTRRRWRRGPGSRTRWASPPPGPPAPRTRVRRRASATPAATTPDEYTRAPSRRTNVGRLIYAGHAGEVARHAGRPAAGERAARLQADVVGDRHEVARASGRSPAAPAQTAGTTSPTVSPRAAPPGGRRAGLRTARADAGPRARGSRAGRRGTAAAPAARQAGSPAVRTSATPAGHRGVSRRRRRGSALNAWMASTGVGSTPYSSAR